MDLVPSTLTPWARQWAPLVRRSLGWCAAACLTGGLQVAGASAQPVPAQPARVPPSIAATSGAVVRGVVSTQNGAIPLGGVLVSQARPRR